MFFSSSLTVELHHLPLRVSTGVLVLAFQGIFSFELVTHKATVLSVKQD